MVPSIEVLRQEYGVRLPTYETLLAAVQEQIKSSCDETGIKIHAIRARIKTFDSFAAKIERKSYTNPWRQCDDLAGIRIICLFEDQVAQIVTALGTNPSLIAVESKKKKKQTDQFSYTAYHMIVQHKDFPKDFVCEIQIRTILQDAWSEMEHYVNYKQLSLDDKSQRKVNALAALFEVAEDQFKDIYDSFQKLHAPQQNSDVQVSAAAIYQFARQTFPDCWNYQPDLAELETKSEYDAVAQIAAEKGITTMGGFIAQVEKFLPTIMARDATRVKEITNSPRQWPKLYEKVKATGHFHTPAALLKRCF